MKLERALLLPLLAAIACSSGEDLARSSSAACEGRTPRVSGLGRQVSFASEVLPVLQRRCSFVSCHGAARQNGWSIPATANAASYPSAVRDALLETAPRPSMPFVTPGKPDESWLLRKVEGDFCGVTCEGGCGDRMPSFGDPLPPAEVNAIAAWIANGAPDN